jgi:dihydroxyacetone kinase-like predicted kinase
MDDLTPTPIPAGQARQMAALARRVAARNALVAKLVKSGSLRPASKHAKGRVSATKKLDTLSVEQIELIIQAKDAHWAVARIAKQVGVSVPDINKFWRQSDAKFRQHTVTETSQSATGTTDVD